MSKTIGAYEAKTHLPALLIEVESGQHIVITKHGRPIARLVPYEAAAPDRRAEVVRKLRNFAKGRTLGTPLKELIEEGRE
jgi:prevent-host-death family protein